jgi:hypothetical protein
MVDVVMASVEGVQRRHGVPGTHEDVLHVATGSVRVSLVDVVKASDVEEEMNSCRGIQSVSGNTINTTRSKRGTFLTSSRYHLTHVHIVACKP